MITVEQNIITDRDKLIEGMASYISSQQQWDAFAMQAPPIIIAQRLTPTEIDRLAKLTTDRLRVPIISFRDLCRQIMNDGSPELLDRKFILKGYSFRKDAELSKSPNRLGIVGWT